MRKFIPLSTFKPLYSNQADLLTEVGMVSFRAQLTTEGVSLAAQAGFSTEDVITFMETLNDPSNVVFYGWIERDLALTDCLLEKKMIRFSDTAQHLKHTLAESYQRFVSPVLANRLLKTSYASDAELEIAFSYVQLLDLDHRAVVENHLFRGINERLRKLEELSETSKNEQDLVNVLKPLCSDEIIVCVNYLSRASYALKLSYVDNILNAIRGGGCTVRLANWMLERLKLVELNQEHAYKINDLSRDLRQGLLTVRNHKKGRTPIRWRAVFTTLFISILLLGTIYILVFKPFSEVESTELSNNTSFREFSREERIQMDSLLREMDHPFEELDTLDPLTAPIPIGVDLNLTLRKPYKNQLMESIYEDLIADCDLKINHPTDSCFASKTVSYRNYSGVKSLASKSGSHRAVVRNESDYNVILYVAENSSGGSVHGAIIKPNETIEFAIGISNTMCIVAGNQFQAFKAPAGAKSEELPSGKFTHHFCDTDLNYEETINTAYEFLHPREGKNKFMVMGAKSGYVHLVDVHQVCEEY
jgi:hypothetical protein